MGRSVRRLGFFFGLAVLAFAFQNLSSSRAPSFPYAPAEFFNSQYVPEGGPKKEFLVDKRFSDLNRSKCFATRQDPGAFSFFHFSKIGYLHDLWKVGSLDERCKIARAGAAKGVRMSADAIAICDLQVLMVRAQNRDSLIQSNAEAIQPYEGNVARTWYDFATRASKSLELSSLGCAIRSAKRSVSTNASDQGCRNAKNLLLKWAQKSAVGSDPFPDAEGGNNGHKALYMGRPIVSFAQTFDLLRSVRGVLSTAEQDQIKDWMNRVARVVLDGQSTWQSWYRRDVQETADNVTTAEGSNHFAQQNLALAAIGGATSNKCYIEYATVAHMNLTHNARHIGRALMIQDDLFAHPYDVFASSVHQGEAIDRYRGHHDEGNLGFIHKARGYPDLVVASFAYHGMLYENLRQPLGLKAADLFTVSWSRYAKDGSLKPIRLFDSLEFYGRMAKRHMQTLRYDSGQAAREDSPYWCSPEVMRLSPDSCKIVCPREWTTRQCDERKAILNSVNPSLYAVYGSFYMRGARQRSSLKALTQQLFYDCAKGQETTAAPQLGIWYEQDGNAWPIHPILWRSDITQLCGK